MSWPQDFATNFQFLLRWLHFLGGITWIGMLYFFNLVNVNFQKELDAATKQKINPSLLSRTLFWFRWGAVVTWVTGFLYYFLIADTENPGHKVLAIFLVGWIVAFCRGGRAAPGRDQGRSVEGRPRSRDRDRSPDDGDRLGARLLRPRVGLEQPRCCRS